MTRNHEPASLFSVPVDLPDPDPALPTIWAAREVRDEPEAGPIIGPVLILAALFWAAVAVVVFA